jgi:hypothetical protein
VDGHVPEQPPGGGDIGRGRRGRVATDDQELLEGADLARRDPPADVAEGRVEAAVEAHHDPVGEGADLGPAGVDPAEVQVDRLLAEHRLAGAHGPGQELDVGRRGRGDDDGVDRRVVDDSVDLGTPRGAQPGTHLASGSLHRVVDVGELGPLMDVDGVGVDPADPATAEQTQPHHGLLLRERGTWIDPSER